MNIAAGGTVGLIGRDTNSNLFDVENGNIIIHAPGVYYAAVTVDVPSEAEVETTMQLELNNRLLMPPQVAVKTSGDSTASNYSGHVVFQADGGSVLRLGSQEFFSIPNSTAQPVFTLTLIRL